MNIAELEDRLFDEGCSGYALQSRGSSYDAFCLTRNEGQWSVFYTERGIDSPPIYSTESESDACEFFLKHMQKQANWHMVGFFTNEQNAIKLEAQLQDLNIEPIRNDIPAFTQANDPRYRVFVAGKQIHSVREKLGSAPIKD